MTRALLLLSLLGCACETPAEEREERAAYTERRLQWCREECGPYPLIAFAPSRSICICAAPDGGAR